MDAIDELGEEGAATQLRIIAVTGGLNGSYRRRAVNTLGQCGAITDLERVAEDTSVHPSIQMQAEELTHL
ncbi:MULTISPECIES: hypothetical protein [Halococcus]|uniref:Uncharacterized protein n=1 Tax=Halococcus salifodinae DSM 8989 TaxID=1227456 RepID=M0NDK1_9EURY|nr:MULTISPECIES: hypothetical protein [Halococcus]EMA55931.1 hypothetical protein C450_00375 [Halococcus salifodinae DSM 8989]